MNNTTIPLWDYKSISSGSQLSICKDRLSADADSYGGLVDIELSDVTIRMNARMAVINLFLFQILTVNRIPICERHVVKRQYFNNGIMTNILNGYYYEILETEGCNKDILKESIMGVYNDLYAFCCVDISEYVSSFDLIDLAEIMHDEAIEPIVDKKYKITPEMGSSTIETYITANAKAMMKLMGTKGALKNESLLTYARVNQLSPFQVPQAMYAFGMRTDVSDTIIPIPVIGSSIDGLRNAVEYAIESLTAKKSAYYTFNSVPNTQYTNRRWQLLGSTIRHIYPVHCKGSIPIPFTIRDYNAHAMRGRNVYLNDKHVWINHNNYGDFVDKEVLMHSPTTCTYRNGICTSCGGKLYENLYPTINPGILSAMVFVEEVTQRVLSAKHFIQTKSINYELPPTSMEMFQTTSINEVSWRNPKTRLKDVYLGIPLKHFGVIHDVSILKDYVSREDHFGEIPFVHVKHAKNNINTKYDLKGLQTPRVSDELLIHMRNNYHNIVITDQIAWIPMEKTNTMTLFRTTIMNDNVLQFVDRVKNFLESSLQHYTSIPHALTDFSELAHSKSSCSMVQMETIMKAYLVTSPEDYRVPIVTNIHDVMFGTNKSILDHRDIGTKLGYEEIKAMTTHPRTYLVPKQESVFDILTRPLHSN